VCPGSAGSSRCSRRRSCCGAAGRSSQRFAGSLRNRSPNMFTLIGLGVGVAYVYSWSPAIVGAERGV
jgi:cation transport ATPase